MGAGPLYLFWLCGRGKDPAWPEKGMLSGNQAVAPGPAQPITGALLGVCAYLHQQPSAETALLLYSFSHLIRNVIGLGATGVNPHDRAGAAPSIEQDWARGSPTTASRGWGLGSGCRPLTFSLLQRQEDVRLTLESPWAVELPLAALQVRGHLFDTQGLGRRWRLRVRPCPTSSRHPPPACTHKAP